MDRWFPVRWARVGFSYCCLLAALPSCGAVRDSDGPGRASGNDKPLFVVGVVATDASECVVRGDKDSLLLPKGVLDLAFTASYTATLLVGAQFQSASSTTSAPQTERITLHSAEITLKTGSGAALGTYTTAGTGFIDTAADTSAYGSMTIPLVPAELHEGASLQGNEPIVATIKVEGEALDGTPLTSSTLTFPIDVCTGCLVRYPPEAADPVEVGPYKCSTSNSFTTPDEPPCRLGQDTAFSCKQCSASLEICRDPAQNPAYQ